MTYYAFVRQHLHRALFYNNNQHSNLESTQAGDLVFCLSITEQKGFNFCESSTTQLILPNLLNVRNHFIASVRL